MPCIPSAGELKTKPTQHSVKELLSVGIQPDMLLCRCDREIPLGARKKIALFCNLREEARDPGARRSTRSTRCRSAITRQGFDREVLRAFRARGAPSPICRAGRRSCGRVQAPEGEVQIAVVGKYTNLLDAYKSLAEALTHGGIANNVRVSLNWLEFEVFENGDDAVRRARGRARHPRARRVRRARHRGQDRAVRFARERKVPYFGICFGMQMAVIEAARDLAGIRDAQLHRVRPDAEPGRRPDRPNGRGATRWSAASIGDNLGGTMRLGAYDALLKTGSRVAEIYGATHINERHRHRYEVNINYKDRLEKAGLLFSGMSPDGLLPEIVEIPDHPWFIGVQFHPELKSKPFDPHPLFTSFIEGGGRAEPAGLNAAIAWPHRIAPRSVCAARPFGSGPDARSPNRQSPKNGSMPTAPSWNARSLVRSSASSVKKAQATTNSTLIASRATRRPLDIRCAIARCVSLTSFDCGFRGAAEDSADA